jgi:hypothetical protein
MLDSGYKTGGLANLYEKMEMLLAKCWKQEQSIADSAPGHWLFRGERTAQPPGKN